MELSNEKEVDVLAREINKDWWNKNKDTAIRRKNIMINNQVLIMHTKKYF
jgi:hypothetical protein